MMCHSTKTLVAHGHKVSAGKSWGHIVYPVVCGFHFSIFTPSPAGDQGVLLYLQERTLDARICVAERGYNYGNNCHYRVGGNEKPGFIGNGWEAQET